MRTIDADRLKVVLEKNFDHTGGASVLEQLIDEQPTVEPETHWIPCSERLPEYNESVLTWDGYVFCIEKRIPYIRDDDGEPIEGDWWVGNEYDEYASEYYPNLRDGAAIAWMPLPEPYREEMSRWLVCRENCGGCHNFDGFGCDRSPIIKEGEEKCRCDGRKNSDG